MQYLQSLDNNLIQTVTSGEYKFDYWTYHMLQLKNNFFCPFEMFISKT